jgi:acyl-coenzyme A thioesterase PaaI-like protein
MTADDELADALRAVLARFQAVGADEDRVAQATALAREMHQLLDGPPRPRWYEGELFEGAIHDGREARIRRRRYGGRSLYRGTANPLAPPLVTTMVEQADGNATIEARVTLGRLYEGPPNGVHGGYVAGMFDDVLGSTQSLIEGPTGLTGTLHVRYRNVTPLDTELTFRAWVHHASGRRIQSRATCHAGGVLTAEAEALFVRVDLADLARRAAERGVDPEG